MVILQHKEGKNESDTEINEHLHRIFLYVQILNGFTLTRGAISPAGKSKYGTVGIKSLSFRGAAGGGGRRGGGGPGGIAGKPGGGFVKSGKGKIGGLGAGGPPP